MLTNDDGKMQEIRRKEFSNPKCIWERRKWEEEKTAKENSVRKLFLLLQVLCNVGTEQINKRKHPAFGITEKQKECKASERKEKKLKDRQNCVGSVTLSQVMIFCCS